MSWAHVPPPERCSCCALPDVPEPYLQRLEWDTHVRDCMASRAGLLEHTLSLDGWATIDAAHVRKWFRPFCFCFSDSRYKRLAPACIHNEWLPPRLRAKRYSRPEPSVPVPPPPPPPAAAPEHAGLLEYYADEVTNHAATEWTVAPPQPDTVPLDAVLQLVALPDLRGPLHTDGFVQVKGSGPPVSVAELEANLYDSTANPNDSDGNILEDPVSKAAQPQGSAAQNAHRADNG